MAGSPRAEGRESRRRRRGSADRSLLDQRFAAVARRCTRQPLSADRRGEIKINSMDEMRYTASQYGWELDDGEDPLELEREYG